MRKSKKIIRMHKLLAFAFTVMLKMYWYRIRRKPENEWNRLWEQTGRRFRQTLFEMEGLLIKIGQFLSIRSDLLPKPFIDQIQDLVDQVPPSEWQQIKELMEAEWKSGIEDKVMHIDPVPVASASIGEVYKGKLKDGTKIAIKVQRPLIQEIIAVDFQSLSIILYFVRNFAPLPPNFINFKQLYKELKHVIEKELNYLEEMRTIQYFQNRLKASEGVIIPETFPELCTEKVLVMEWITGARATDLSFIEKTGIVRKEIAEKLLYLFLPQWLEPGMFHADPHGGNILITENGKLALLDFGMAGEITQNDAKQIQHLLAGFLLKNYREAALALKELGFLLPGADLDLMAERLKEASSMRLQQITEKDLFSVKKEMNEAIRSLPIQVPARFIFLGRSFASIEGLFRTIAPDEDFLPSIRPVFINWINKQYPNKWELVKKWAPSLPFWQTLRSAHELIQLPNKSLKQKENHKLLELKYTSLENTKQRTFYLGILGVFACLGSVHIKSDFLFNGSLVILLLSIFGYSYASLSQKKQLKVGLSKNNK